MKKTKTGILTSFLVAIVTVISVILFWKNYRASLAPEFPLDAVGGNYMPYRDNFNLTAPEIPSGFKWINSKPMSLKELRGNVVLLDFWTYCCINCIHVIPDLKYIEEKFRDKPVVVIGVHAAKFDNEEDEDNIRNAVMRYGIEHPVVIDEGMRVWDSYNISSWPSFILIAPDGQLAMKLSGEGQRQNLEELITSLLNEYGKKGLLAQKAPDFSPEKPTTQTGLLYPGKVAVDVPNNRIFISDTGHNRIVVTALDGTVLEKIGQGTEGYEDGDFESAQFMNPQGLEFAGDRLYIADTGNHVIRLADFETKTVSTIAGTGEQMGWGNMAGGDARKIALSSPWDLKLVGDKLYIAVAGRHLIYEMDISTGRMFRFAGNGYEARQDGTRLTSSFAQPSGLTFLDDTLYVADSEISSIRAIDLDRHDVKTVAGGNLFDFGDVDGTGDEARLQHPLGVSADDGVVYVADSYNQKIKKFDPRVTYIRTYAGTGKVGYMDGSLEEAEFSEPGGLYATNGLIYVADTNNHRIRIIDTKNETVKTLEINGL